jgi:bifunctional DNase/RNase
LGNDFKDLFGDRRPDDDGSIPEIENRIRRPLQEKEVRVINVYEAVLPENIGSQSTQKTTFVLLRDNSGRECRIFVLPDVAYAISMGLENESPDRPFTHDLMKTLIERLGGVVERITIDDLWQETFYARITMTRDSETMDIDARPSDAIALALRFRAPIYVAESVLEAAQQE